MSFRPRSAARVSAIALVGLLGFSACTSTPSPRRVALDAIESLDLPAEQEQCMSEVVGSYTDQELKQMAEDNKDLAFGSENAIEAGTEEFQLYFDQLERCRTGEAAPSETTEGAEGTASSQSTEASETTDAGDVSEAADTTEADDADTTEPSETTEG